jgi:hypothetical protein
MTGSVSWEALILVVAAIWLVGAAVGWVVWQLCRVVQDINIRLARLEARLRADSER